MVMRWRAGGSQLPAPSSPCRSLTHSQPFLLTAHSAPAPPCLPHTGAFNDWNKDRQFQKLSAQKEVIEVKVVRSSGSGGSGASQAVLTVPNTELVVGDVVVLDTGDKIVADGYIIEVGGAVLWWGSGVG